MALDCENENTLRIVMAPEAVPKTNVGLNSLLRKTEKNVG